MSKGGALFCIVLGSMATVDFVGGIAWAAKEGMNFVGTLCVFGLFFSIRLVINGIYHWRKS